MSTHVQRASSQNSTAEPGHSPPAQHGAPFSPHTRQIPAVHRNEPVHVLIGQHGWSCPPHSHRPVVPHDSPVEQEFPGQHGWSRPPQAMQTLPEQTRDAAQREPEQHICPELPHGTSALPSFVTSETPSSDTVESMGARSPAMSGTAASARASIGPVSSDPASLTGTYVVEMQLPSSPQVSSRSSHSRCCVHGRIDAAQPDAARWHRCVSKTWMTSRMCGRKRKRTMRRRTKSGPTPSTSNVAWASRAPGPGTTPNVAGSWTLPSPAPRIHRTSAAASEMVTLPARIVTRMDSGTSVGTSVLTMTSICVAGWMQPTKSATASGIGSPRERKGCDARRTERR